MKVYTATSIYEIRPEGNRFAVTKIENAGGPSEIPVGHTIRGDSLTIQMGLPMFLSQQSKALLRTSLVQRVEP